MPPAQNSPRELPPSQGSPSQMLCPPGVFFPEVVFPRRVSLFFMAPLSQRWTFFYLFGFPLGGVISPFEGPSPSFLNPLFARSPVLRVRVFRGFGVRFPVAPRCRFCRTRFGPMSIPEARIRWKEARAQVPLVRVPFVVRVPRRASG